MPFISSVRGATAQEIADFITNGEEIANRVVLTGGAAGIKGAWVQLIAALAANTYFLNIGLSPTSAIQSANAVEWADFDIGVGPPAGEIPVITNLLWAARSDFFSAGAAIRSHAVVSGMTYRIKTRIQVGGRVAARVASEQAAETFYISVWGEQV